MQHSTLITGKSVRPASGSAPRVLALIVNYNGGDWLTMAVASLVAQTFPVSIAVIDNGSTDGSLDNVSRLFAGRCETIPTGQNLGAAGGYNWALRYPDYDYYFFLNPDAKAPPSCVETLVQLMESHGHLGVIGPTIVDFGAQDRVQEFAPALDFMLFPFDAFAGHSTSELPSVELVPSFYACAAAMLVRARAFRDVEGCDADFFMFADESDLSWRMRLIGWETAVAPGVRVEHVGGATATVGVENGTYRTSERRIYLRERNSMWMGIKCFAFPTLVAYLTINVSHLLLEIILLRVLRQHGIADAYIRALKSVLESFPKTWSKRKSIQHSRKIAERHVLRFFTLRYAKFSALAKRGMPKVVGFTK